MSSKRILSQLYAFVTVVMWSGAFVVTRLALKHFTTGALGLLRCALAAGCLLILLTWSRQLTVRFRDIPVFFISGACGFALYFLAFNTGSLSVNPTTCSVVIALCPVISSVLAQCVFKEKLSACKWLATGVAFSGVVMMLLWDGSLQMSLGGIWILCAALLLGIYNLMQRGLAERFSPLKLTTYSFLAGTVLLAWMLPEAVAQLRDAPSSYLIQAAFLGIFPGALAFLTWGKALAMAEETSQVTNWMFLIPLITLLLEFMVSGELPGMPTFVGGGIIICALVFFFKAPTSAYPDQVDGNEG